MNNNTSIVWDFDESTQTYKDSQVQTVNAFLSFACSFVSHFKDDVCRDLLEKKEDLQLDLETHPTPSLEEIDTYIARSFEKLCEQSNSYTHYSFVLGKIISAIATNETKLLQQKTPTNNLIDNLHFSFECINAVLALLKKELQTNWQTEFVCEGVYSSKFAETFTLETLSNMKVPEKGFPDSTASEYITMFFSIRRPLVCSIVSKLLKFAWKIRRWPTFLIKDDYFYEGDPDTRFWDFDETVTDTFLDDRYSIQKIKGFPDERLGDTYIHRTTNGAEWFQIYLSGLIGSKAIEYNYKNYSSYYNFLESANFVDGNKHYTAYNLHNYLLVDNKGNTASPSVTEWLFVNDCTGTASKFHGVATRKEIFEAWDLEVEHAS